MVSLARLGIGAAVVAALSWLVYLVDREWYSLIVMRRMSKMLDPNAGKVQLAKLVKKLPKSDEPKYVILSIPPKMGTTWVGHITYQLLSHGKDVDPSLNLMMDSPYPEFADKLFDKWLHELDDPPYWKREPFASYPHGPVTIRTHCHYEDLLEIHATERDNFRLVTVLRDPADVIVSMWRFMPTVVGIDYKLVPFMTIVRLMRFFGILDKMFTNYADFWEKRHDPNVLIIFFAGLKHDLTGNVRRLADLLLLSPPLTDSEFNTVVNQSTHGFMSSAEVSGRFNEMPKQMQDKSWKEMGITAKDVHVDFKSVGVVRKDGGNSGDGKKTLSEGVKLLISEQWKKHVLPRTGCNDLEEMRLKFQAERAARVKP